MLMPAHLPEDPRGFSPVCWLRFSFSETGVDLSELTDKLSLKLAEFEACLRNLILSSVSGSVMRRHGTAVKTSSSPLVPADSVQVASKTSPTRRGLAPSVTVSRSTLPPLAVSSSTVLLLSDCCCDSLSVASSTDLILMLPDLLAKELAMLATLSLRIMEEAEERTKCSPRALVVMPGNGNTSRLHTSVSKASRRARSLRGGARTGTRCVASRDWERFMVRIVEPSLVASRAALVFFRITWHNGDFGPTVVAR